MAEFASKGIAGAGLGLGIAGTALGLLNGGGTGLLGLTNVNTLGENAAVNRYELNMAQELAKKDAQIGLLEADKYTDQKIVESTTYLMGRIKDLETEVRTNKDAQVAVNMQQAVYNGTNTAALGCLQAQVQALQGITKLVIPNGSVCPGWGNVNVTPAAATAATT